MVLINSELFTTFPLTLFLSFLKQAGPLNRKIHSAECFSISITNISILVDLS